MFDHVVTVYMIATANGGANEKFRTFVDSNVSRFFNFRQAYYGCYALFFGAQGGICYINFALYVGLATVETEEGS